MTEPLATEAQSSYIDGLIEGKDLTEAHLQWIEAHRPGLTKAKASEWIQHLLARPWREDYTPSVKSVGFPGWKVEYKDAAEDGNGRAKVKHIGFLKRGDTVVPRGGYALETPQDTHANDTTFYRLWIGDRYGWRLYLLHGPEETQIDRKQAESILEQIAKDPLAAASRFGLAIGKCGICNRRLTNDLSRSLGIGPICRENWGW